MKQISKRRLPLIEKCLYNVEQYLRSSGAANISPHQDFPGFEWDRDRTRCVIRFFPYTSPNRFSAKEDSISAIIQVYPGISAEEPYASLVAEYIEECISPFMKKEVSAGHLQLDFSTGDVMYEAKLLFDTEPFSAESLRLVEFGAKHVLHSYFSPLEALAHGHLPRSAGKENRAGSLSEHVKEPVAGLSREAKMMLSQKIRDFCKSHPGHGHYCKNLDTRDGLPLWRLELHTLHGFYRASITFSHNGLLMMSAHRGKKQQPVQAPYRAGKAFRFQRLSGQSAAVTFHLGSEDSPLEAAVTASLLEDPDVYMLLHRMEFALLDEIDLMSVHEEFFPRGSRQRPFPRLRNYVELHEGRQDDSSSEIEDPEELMDELLSHTAKGVDNNEKQQQGLGSFEKDV